MSWVTFVHFQLTGHVKNVEDWNKFYKFYIHEYGEYVLDVKRIWRD